MSKGTNAQDDGDDRGDEPSVAVTHLPLPACAGRASSVALEFVHLDLAARPALEPDRLVRPDSTDIDLTIGKNHHAARTDAHHHDADRSRAQAFCRPTLERLVIGRLPPRARQAWIDERRDVAAGVDGEREFRAIRLPFVGKLRIDHPVAIVAAALGRPRLVDPAADPALDVLAPHARRLAELVDRLPLAAHHAGAAFAARNETRPGARIRAGRLRVSRHACNIYPASRRSGDTRHLPNLGDSLGSVHLVAELYHLVRPKYSEVHVAIRQNDDRVEIG